MRPMDLLATVQEAWGWTGLRCSRVVGENDFGNLIVEAADGRFWRICPEEPDCSVVAESRMALDALSKDQDFLHDWAMSRLVELARDSLGLLRPGYKYCLKVPAVLGGSYEAENLAQMPLRELVSVSGDIARQIRDLPDGAQVQLRIMD